MTIGLVRLKGQLQPARNASRYRDSRPRKEACEIQYVDTIGEVRNLDLQQCASQFFAVQLCAGGDVDCKSWTRTLAVKIDAIKNCGAVLGKQKTRSLGRAEIGRKSATVLGTHSYPHALLSLKPDTSTRGVALVLGHGELTRVGKCACGVAA